MAVNLKQQLEQQNLSLTDKLNQYEQYVKQVQGGNINNLLDFSTRPEGANPLTRLQALVGLSEDMSNTRQSLMSQSANNQDQLQRLYDREADQEVSNRKFALDEASSGLTYDSKTGTYKPIQGSGVVSEDMRIAEESLRKEFTAKTKEIGFEEVRAAYKKIKSTSDTGAGDISLIVAYMKLLDPQSVVREAEFKTAAEAGSYFEKVTGRALKFTSGQRLAPEVRKQFKQEAAINYNIYVDRQMQVNRQFDELAIQYGLDNKRITGGIGRVPKEKIEQQQQPQQQSQGGILDLLLGGYKKQAAGILNMLPNGQKPQIGGFTIEEVK